MSFQLPSNMDRDFRIVWVTNDFLPVFLTDGEASEKLIYTKVKHRFFVEGSVIHANDMAIWESQNVFWLSVYLKADFNASGNDKEDLLDLLNCL